MEGKKAEEELVLSADQTVQTVVRYFPHKLWSEWPTNLEQSSRHQVIQANADFRRGVPIECNCWLLQQRLLLADDYTDPV